MTSGVEFGRRDWHTGLLVIQPTPFCNINCSYCYLPHRTTKKRMSLEVAERVFERLFKFPTIEDTVGVVWHAGEPMVLPPSYYEEMFTLIQRIAGPKIEVRHSFQTNGTLITDAWCDLIDKWKVNLGLSIDGPAEFHDLYRKMRNGGGSFAAAERGLRVVKARKLPFYVISVLTLASVRHPEKMFDFFDQAGIDDVCFNIEEKEGINTSSDAIDSAEFVELYGKFLSRFFELAVQREKRMVVREFESSLRAIHGYGKGVANQQADPFSIVSVDCDGNASTFSPELLGMEHSGYETFNFGNLLEDDFETIAKRVEDSKLYADIRAGVKRCSEECQYYQLCGGGPPANKIYENNTANSTETVYCRAHQAAVDVVLEMLEKIPQGALHLSDTKAGSPESRLPPI
jgi:uncharacterized protein